MVSGPLDERCRQPRACVSGFGEEAADEGDKLFGLFFHEQVPGGREQVEAHSSGDVGAQALGPLRPEVRVIAAPDDQGGVGEATQSRDRGGGGLLVGGVELSGEEASGLGAAAPVGQVRLE